MIKKVVNKQSLKNGQWLKFFLCILMVALYFMVIKISTEMAYPSYYYFDPTVSPFFTIINCGIIIILIIIIDKKRILRLFRHKALFTSLVSVLLIFFILPFLFLKQGIVADDICIQKKDLFGRTKSEFKYINISNIDISVKRGIQYEIQFNAKEKIWIFSHDAGIRNFKNDENLLNFDKAISQYKEKTVTDDPAWITPNNTHRFIKDENVFQYFDLFFSQYYSNDGQSQTRGNTGDG